MSYSASLKELLTKIETYKSKYYKNLLIKGVLVSSALLVSSFLFFNFLEYFGRFNQTIRGIIFFSFLAIFIATLVFWIIRPLLYFFRINEPLNNTNAAENIGKFFPEIGDKLLNTLQLSQLSSADNSLLNASIEQKSKSLKFYNFADAINLNTNKQYLKYVLPPLALCLAIGFFAPQFFKKSTERIVYFRKDFAEEAPFKFEIKNKELKAIKNEDFTLQLELVGNAIPEEVYLVYNDRKFKMNSSDAKHYEFTFSKVQAPLEFFFTASGFKSNEFEIELLSRPNLLSFDIELNYPAYLNKPSESFDNVGNIVVPEGTHIEWNVKATDTDELFFHFNAEKPSAANKGFINGFSFEKQIKNSSSYSIILKNASVQNKDNISYYINVIPDKYPQLQVEQAKDTTLYNYIVLGGNITDDYGLNQFKLFYRTVKESNPSTSFTAIDIPFNKTQLSQSFYYQLPIFNLAIEQGDKIEYYLQVWDNDGVNGSKSTKTPILSFAMPSNKSFSKDVNHEIEKTENLLEKLADKSKEFKNELNNLENKLKTKKDLDFQDKKKLDELLNKREKLIEDIKKLQDQVESLQEKQNRFTPQSQELQQKMEMLKQLMKELLDNADNKLLEEMKKMLENKNDDKTIEQLEKLKKNDRNLDKDIDRTLKLFKQLQLKQKVEQVAKELEKLADKQEKLAEKTEKNSDTKKNEELAKEQEKLSKEFNEQKEKLNEVDILSKELKKDIDSDKDSQKEISENQKNAENELGKNDNPKSSKSQKKASRSMRNMAQKMSEQMKDAEMKELDEDMDALRDILENLVKLSFDQERVMKNFKNLPLSDPRFIPLSQDQLKLVDDSKTIEDSLYSLASRVMQIKSFVTKEVTTMKNSMDESLTLIRDRKLNQASAKQQFSMTSINNLALLLSDVFKQMQQMAGQGMPGSGKGGKKGKMPSPSLGESQQQLNQRMESLSKGQSQGRSLSEELSKLANEQSRLRKQVQQMQEDLKGTELGKKIGNQLSELQNKMNETETDLVNKRINPELIKRQREIQTRLLEAEKAMKQQEEDPTRQSKTANNFNRQSPPSIDKYLLDKQKQLELIRTTPPNYTPFYKLQTDNYFKRIK